MARQGKVDALAQLFHAHGLGYDDLITTHGDGIISSLVVGHQGADDNDRYVFEFRMFFEAGAEVTSVHAWHDNVEEDDIGLELAGDAIESIKCYLTGRAQADGTFTIRKLSINDKHGLTRNVFNAKINIYRCSGEPILLGIEDRLLRGDELAITTTAHIRTDSESA